MPIPKFFKIAAGIALCQLASLFPVQAEQASFSLLDANIVFALPEGYCQVPTDNPLWEFSSAAFGKSVNIGVLLSPCDKLKLKPYAMPDEYLAVAVIGINHNFVKFRLGKPLYVAMVASFKPSSLNNFEQRVNKRLKKYGGSVDALEYSLLYQNRSEAAFKGSAILTYGGVSKNESLFGITTLVKQLPIMVLSLDGSGQERQDLKTLETLYKNVVNNN